MARRRYVSTDISIDTLLVKLQKHVGYFGPLLYTWMLPHAGDDCHITSDLEELQLMVIPGFKVKPDQVQDAVDYMLEIGLILSDAAGLYFPPRTFYKHQSYIPEAKRWQEPERELPPNAADCRESPQITASPSLSPSPSPTPSPSPSLSASANGEAGVEFPSALGPAFPDDPVPENTYVGRYVRAHQVTHAGNPPSPIHQAAARKLERDFDTPRCIEAAEDYGWDTHPNYLREVLNDPKRGRRKNAGQPRAAPGANPRSRAEEARAILARR